MLEFVIIEIWEYRNMGIQQHPLAVSVLDWLWESVHSRNYEVISCGCMTCSMRLWHTQQTFVLAGDM